MTVQLPRDPLASTVILTIASRYSPAPPGKNPGTKLRVSSISDQDDAGPWIRREFPQLFYIVTPSNPDGGNYAYATWTGISGDLYYRNGGGADTSVATNARLDAHIRSQGALGKLYPRFAFILEGDTPSFLNLIDKGSPVTVYRGRPAA